MKIYHKVDFLELLPCFKAHVADLERCNDGNPRLGGNGTRYHCLLSTNTSLDGSAVRVGNQCFNVADLANRQFGAFVLLHISAGSPLVCRARRQHCGHSDNDRPCAE
jgi:hypothetical protein